MDPITSFILLLLGPETEVQSSQVACMNSLHSEYAAEAEMGYEIERSVFRIHAVLPVAACH